jgi:aspartyl protease family protein
MGHVWVKVKIGDVERRKVLEVKGLVNTGATLTVIPRELARERWS